MNLSDKAIKLLAGKNFGFLATVEKKGYPHVTPVWVDYSDGFILINSTKDRVKVKNVERDPRVSLAVSDSQNPYRYVMIQGKVKQITEEGAKEHIDRLAFKYTGVKKFQGGNDRRVILKIEPEKVIESL